MEYKRDLMILQQNSYRNERYMRWLRTSGDMTSYVRVLGYIAFLVMISGACPLRVSCVAGAVPLLINIWNLITATYKKPLVWTNRAKRIYATTWILTAAALAGVWAITGSWYATATAIVGAYLFSHVLTMAANYVLKPVEAHINRGYYNDAASRLKSMPGLKVIGITGSYGKTSTKHYLNRILSEQFNVVMTPGSYNTTMGVIRTIREMLPPYTEIFICEMGAKNIGDIREICDLVHPDMGIITAVGEQHLESFKTIENVQRTKFELADAIPQEGLVMVNNDFPYAASRKVDNTTALRYSIGENAGSDFHVSDIAYSSCGTTFTLHGPMLKEPLKLHTRLVGECNISNLIPAIAIALHLGMDTKRIQIAVAAIEQVEHRLSVKRTAGGITILDDAFNSNPDGSRMALDVLASMSDNGSTGRRIIVTPGMIELGAKQEEYNERFGKKIAACADIAIVVGAYNRDAILRGLRAEGMDEACVHAVDSFAEAQALLAQLPLRNGDTVLYENDLPDTFK